MRFSLSILSLALLSVLAVAAPVSPPMLHVRVHRLLNLFGQTKDSELV